MNQIPLGSSGQLLVRPFLAKVMALVFSITTFAISVLLMAQTSKANPPMNVSVIATPSSGPNGTMTFTASSDAGANNLAWIQGIINQHPDGRDACYFSYGVADSRLYLSKDGASGDWMGSGHLGDSTVLSNSQCQIDLSTASVSVGSTTVALTLHIHFYSIFNGPQPIWMLTGDVSGGMDAAL